ncbi:MAG: ABC transporter ATP-binding protein [Opitutaceae bacterium]|nr:ABC transporter ATP-binding protein [Opitutaceae bacterium]
MSDLLLKASALTKSFPSGNGTISVLENIDFDVYSGDSISIRGESGSGKSTLLNLLAGLEKPDAGTVAWRNGKPVDASVRGREVGIVFQSFYLIPELTAVENVLMAKRITGKVSANDRARASQLLQEVGLGDRATHAPAKLSGGERQRVAVARALMNQPALIVADEPTGNLDERTGDRVMDTLFALCEASRTALVLVTHNPLHAKRAARQFQLLQGKLHVVQQT